MRFLEQSESICNQLVNLQTDCRADSLSFLNVQLYELLELFVDNERTNNKVKVQIKGSAGSTELVEDGDNLCTCKNYVQAVEYTV